MAKKQPKPDPTEDQDDESVPEGPTPWNIEIEFNDPERKSAMHAVRIIHANNEHVQLQLEDGKVVAYMFSDIHKILVMHSVKYDGYLKTQAEQPSEEAPD